VRRQIGLASAGRVLASSAGGESHRNWFYSAPVDEASAEALVAYWLAVGARVGYPALLVDARRFYTRADGRIKALSSSDASGISNVIDEGVAALERVKAFQDRRMAGIYRGLGMNRRADEIERAQQLAYQQSNAYVVIEGTKDVARKGARGLEKAGRVLRNEPPPGTPRWLWWIQRNALFLGIGAVALGVAYLYLSPFLAPLLKARDAAVARIGTATKNPRRRRRFNRRSR
jgi:hypothetical protein